MHAATVILEGQTIPRPDRWRCRLCGRDKFTARSPHRCRVNGVRQLRKHHIRWEPIYMQNDTTKRHDSPWEELDAWTRRMAVPGGWLYQIATMGPKGPNHGPAGHPPVFVPAPPASAPDPHAPDRYAQMALRLEDLEAAKTTFFRVIERLCDPNRELYGRRLGEDRATVEKLWAEFARHYTVVQGPRE